MKTGIKIAIVAGLAVVVVGVVALKNRNKLRPEPVPRAQVAAMTAEAATSAAALESAAARAEGPLPRLLDLGAGKCIPCKMMAPILEELKQELLGDIAELHGFARGAVFRNLKEKIDGIENNPLI